MDTEKLKAALQEMIVGGSMIPASKSRQSTSPPASGSGPRLWGPDLKQRLQVLFLLGFAHVGMLAMTWELLHLFMMQHCASHGKDCITLYGVSSAHALSHVL